MKTTPMRLKQSAGWFAAGREVDEALTLLSDAAFKLFVWLCLHADRSCGALQVEPHELVQALGKSQTELAALFEDLFLGEICRRTADGSVEIRDRFWPYERAIESSAAADAPAYVGKVRQFMVARACVRCLFSTADQRLALQLHRRGVPLETVERAIHLGCLRKYAALLNHSGGTPITSFHYFTHLFEEVQQSDVSAQYWHYVAAKLEKLERQWAQAQPPHAGHSVAAVETR